METNRNWEYILEAFSEKYGDFGNYMGHDDADREGLLAFFAEKGLIEEDWDALEARGQEIVKPDRLRDARRRYEYFLGELRTPESWTKTKMIPPPEGTPSGMLMLIEMHPMNDEERKEHEQKLKQRVENIRLEILGLEGQGGKSCPTG